MPVEDLFVGVDVATACDNGVGDVELRPQVSKPSSDEPDSKK